MTVESDEDSPVIRPCMIVADSDPVQAATLSRLFRFQGWDVYHARTGAEARRLSHMLEPDILIMSTALPGESGWLTSEKISKEMPQIKIFLLGDSTDPSSHAFASFVGAVRLVNHCDSVNCLIEEVGGRCLPAAG